MITLRGIVTAGGNDGACLGARRWVREIGGVVRHDSYSELSVITDRTYRLSETASGLLIHDGRAEKWQDDPRAWNGSFLAIGGGSAGWRIWTDRLGTVPLFWASVQGGTIVSSRLVDLLEFRNFGPDPVGVLQAVMLNHPLGERTVVAGVSLMPPAGILDVAADGVYDRGRYWEPKVRPGDRDAEYVDRGVAVLRNASERVLAGRDGALAWPVTGGADSRCCLALNLDRLGDEDVLFHVTELGRSELPLARAIAEGVQRELQVLDPTESIRAWADTDLRKEAGELHVGQWFLLPAAEQLAGQFACNRVVDGYLLDSLLKPSMIQSGTAEQVRDRLLHWAQYRLQRFGICNGRRADRMLDASAAEYPSDDSGLSASQRYTLENRSRRMVFGHVRLQGNYLDVRTPGLDTELIDFALDLPWASREGGWLYRRIIHSLAPDLARIPHDRTGLPLISDQAASHRRKVLARARYYANRILPGPDRFPGRESRFERLLRLDAGFRQGIYSCIRESEWLAEAMGGDPVVALERQRRSGTIISDCLGNMLQIALLERHARACHSQARV